MANERKTEQLVRDLLKEKGYYDNINIIIDEQISTNSKINDILKTASKKGTGKIRKPEFIIWFKDNSDILIIIECKADNKYHESEDRQSPISHAVDGVLHYVSFLKNNYNVIGIAVSGQNTLELKISSFLWLKENFLYKKLQKSGTIFSYLEFTKEIHDKNSIKFDESSFLKWAQYYNEVLYRYSIPDIERCTVMSALLISLQDDSFLVTYEILGKKSNKDLINGIFEACKRVLDCNKLPQEKIDIMISEYKKFQFNSDFNAEKIFNRKLKKEEPNTILRDLIFHVKENILPFIKNKNFDILGRFYRCFIKYAGSDKKNWVGVNSRSYN